MSSAHSTVEIQCPIGLFERQEAKIAALTKAINAAKTASEKAPHARMLIEEANVLLDCASYDRANQNCGLCRSFSELRLKTASLIVKIGAPGAAR
ncbi:MAG: hypothetical protein ABSC37_04940 [Xanthobacteraceae bacterium]